MSTAVKVRPARIVAGLLKKRAWLAEGPTSVQSVRYRGEKHSVLFVISGKPHVCCRFDAVEHSVEIALSRSRLFCDKAHRYSAPLAASIVLGLLYNCRYGKTGNRERTSIKSA